MDSAKDVRWIIPFKKFGMITSMLNPSLLIGVDPGSAIAVDISSGNIYISTGGQIKVVNPYREVRTAIDGANIEGQIGKIAVMPQSGY